MHHKLKAFFFQSQYLHLMETLLLITFGHNSDNSIHSLLNSCSLDLLKYWVVVDIRLQ